MLTDNPARYKQLQATLGQLGRELPGPLAGFASLQRAPWRKARCLPGSRS